MRDHLSLLGIAIRAFLDRELPALGPDWWHRGVISALTYQQGIAAREHGWSTLRDLDVAALLRVVDRNWDLFRRRNLVSKEVRNWVHEATSIRHRWAHEPPGKRTDPHRVYRDLDTLALLSAALSPDSTEAAQLAAARADALANLTPRDTKAETPSHTREEIGTPQASPEPDSETLVSRSGQLPLAEAMHLVLKEKGKLKATPLIAEIRRRGLYTTRNGGPPSSQQVHNRASSRPDLIGKEGSYFYAK